MNQNVQRSEIGFQNVLVHPLEARRALCEFPDGVRNPLPRFHIDFHQQPLGFLPRLWYQSGYRLSGLLLDLSV